ncbi:MAG: hypothetical protein ACYS5V_08350 [Planctomycetota bacterium]|jgi:hypothetical protein
MRTRTAFCVACLSLCLGLCGAAAPQPRSASTKPGKLTISGSLSKGRLLLSADGEGVKYFDDRPLTAALATGSRTGDKSPQRGKVSWKMLARKGEALTAGGTWDFGGQASPVTLTVTPARRGDQFTIALTITPQVDVLAELGIRLPVRLAKDEKQRFAILPDGDHQRYEHWILRDPYLRGYPKWRHGGVTQIRPGSYVLWKVCDRDTPALTNVWGKAFAGWMMLCDMTQGVVVGLEGFPDRQQAELHADNEAGLLSAYVVSHRMPPLSLAPTKVSIPGAATRARRLKLAKGKPFTFTVTVRCQQHTPDSGRAYQLQKGGAYARSMGEAAKAIFQAVK